MRDDTEGKSSLIVYVMYQSLHLIVQMPKMRCESAIHYLTTVTISSFYSTDYAYIKRGDLGTSGIGDALGADIP